MAHRLMTGLTDISSFRTCRLYQALGDTTGLVLLWLLAPVGAPTSTKKVIGFGSSSFIGLLDDKTVLKYPRTVGEQWERLDVEYRIYTALGSHPRILACYELDERGLQLEYASRGTVRGFLHDPDCPISSCDRLRWCQQAAEALAYVHTKNVVHCDISTRNFLLDRKLDVKLSDFQGIYVDHNGKLFNGYALESTKSYLPRLSTSSDKKSDMFALGSAIYEIMVGHEPFPELNELDDEAEIERRYTNGQFPTLNGVLGGAVIQKCWSLVYDHVNACVEELQTLLLHNIALVIG